MAYGGVPPLPCRVGGSAGGRRNGEQLVKASVPSSYGREERSRTSPMAATGVSLTTPCSATRSIIPLVLEIVADGMLDRRRQRVARLEVGSLAARTSASSVRRRRGRYVHLEDWVDRPRCAGGAALIGGRPRHREVGAFALSAATVGAKVPLGSVDIEDHRPNVATCWRPTCYSQAKPFRRRQLHEERPSSGILRSAGRRPTMSLAQIDQIQVQTAKGPCKSIVGRGPARRGAQRRRAANLPATARRRRLRAGSRQLREATSWSTATSSWRPATRAKRAGCPDVALQRPFKALTNPRTKPR